MTVTPRHVSDVLADFLCGVRAADIPAPVMAKAKAHLLHMLASAVAGRGTALGDQAVRVARALTIGPGGATIVAERERAGITEAAFANGALMMALSRDDVLLSAGLHPGAVVMPAALAIAERERSSGEDLLVAIVLGYELLGKLGGLAWTWSAKAVPTRASVPFGAFGPAAACAYLLRLNHEQCSRALAGAALMAQGLGENPFGGQFYGHVARNGILAAEIGRAGGTVAPAAIEGEHGVLRTYFGELPPGLDDLGARLGKEWSILGAEFKVYPTTGLNYGAIQVTQELVAQGLRPEAVGRMVLHLSSERALHTAAHSTGPFAGAWAAGSSGPFNVALALTGGDLYGAGHERFADPVLSAIAGSIEIHLDLPGYDAARLEVTTRDGRTLTAATDRFQYRSADQAEHLRANAGERFSASRIAALERTVAELDRLPSVGALTELLRPD